MTAFPEVTDNSMISTWRKCHQLYYNDYIENLSFPGDDIDLFFGGCFAYGIEKARRSFYTNGRPEKEAEADGINAALIRWGAYQEPDKHVKNYRSLMLLLAGYFKHFPMGTDTIRPLGDQGIEFSFAMPLFDILHPDNGRPIIYAGRFDMLGMMDQEPIIVDEKTTGRNFFNWSSGWMLRSQFIGYTWAARTMGYGVQKVAVRGCYVSKNAEDYTTAWVPIPQHTIDRWYKQTIRDISAMIAEYKAGYFDFNLGDACKVFKPCKFLPLCEANKREDWINLYQQKEPWNPLKRPGGEL